MKNTQRPKSRRSAGYKPVKAEKPAKTEQASEKEEKPARKKENIFVKLRNAIFPCKGDSVTESVRKVVFDIAVVALIITGGSLIFDVVDRAVETGKDSQLAEKYDDLRNEDEATIEGQLNLSDEEKEAIRKEQPDILPSFMELYNQNDDIVGWITVGDKDGKIGQIVNHPVMQSADNDYYLTHSFERKETKGGAIFADYRNQFDAGKLSGNTVLYGHNIWDGTMFAKLTRYYDATLFGEYSDKLGFYKENPTIIFDTLYERAEWKVFACVLFNTDEKNGEVYPYTQIQDFESEASFNSFILDIMDRSVLWTDVDLTYGDEILTLSTCYYPYGENIDTRCVVFARKVRDGESTEVDVSKAQRNENPLMFTYQYQVLGGSWKGRTWDTSKLLSY